MFWCLKRQHLYVFCWNQTAAFISIRKRVYIWICLVTQRGISSNHNSADPTLSMASKVSVWGILETLYAGVWILGWIEWSFVVLRDCQFNPSSVKSNSTIRSGWWSYLNVSCLVKRSFFLEGYFVKSWVFVDYLSPFF